MIAHEYSANTGRTIELKSKSRFFCSISNRNWSPV